MAFKITGLDQMQRNLQELQRRVQRLQGPVKFEDLFPPEFMLRYTDYASIDDLVGAIGRPITTTEEFEAVPSEEWDALVSAKTRFKTWEAMKAKAAEEYAQRRLRLDDLNTE